MATEKEIAYRKAWRAARPGYANTTRKARRTETLTHYGGHCVCCGEMNPVFLTFDHIAGDGAEHRRQIGKGTNLAEWLHSHGHPEGFQILCWNCNSAKHILGICPHQKNIDELIERVSTWQTAQS